MSLPHSRPEPEVQTVPAVAQLLTKTSTSAAYQFKGGPGAIYRARACTTVRFRYPDSTKTRPKFSSLPSLYFHSLVRVISSAFGFSATLPYRALTVDLISSSVGVLKDSRSLLHYQPSTLPRPTLPPALRRTTCVRRPPDDLEHISSHTSQTLLSVSPAATWAPTTKRSARALSGWALLVLDRLDFSGRAGQRSEPYYIFLLKEEMFAAGVFTAKHCVVFNKKAIWKV